MIMQVDNDEIYHFVVGKGIYNKENGDTVQK